jgi:hypothetical protein
VQILFYITVAASWLSLPSTSQQQLVTFAHDGDKKSICIARGKNAKNAFII